MTTCTVCGTSNASNAQYCDGCGVELTTDSSVVTPEEPGTMPPSPEASVLAPSEESPSILPAHVAPVETPAAVMDAGPAEPLRTAHLAVKKFGAVTADRLPLLAERLVLGRFDASSGPVDLDVSGLPGAEHISRRHAELSYEQGQWHVRDLGSTNGVYIKRAGEAGFSPRLQEPAALAHGDELALGNLMLVFQEG